MTIAVSDVVDDHADLQADATAAGVGEPVEGVLHYDGGVDLFVFEAESGESYEIRVAPNTPEAPWTRL